MVESTVKSQPVEQDYQVYRVKDRCFSDALKQNPFMKLQQRNCSGRIALHSSVEPANKKSRLRAKSD